MDPQFSWEKLSEEILICVTPYHKFGTDAFLLSNFAKVKRKDRACDLGTGCGIIPLLWYRSKEEGPKQAYGVDIQELAIRQLRKSIQRSGLEDKLTPLLADLKELGGLVPKGELDLVTCNPPYKAENSGILSEWDCEKIARHETMCSMDDVAKAASALLKFGGRLCVCQRPERLPDVLEAMRHNGLEPKRLRFVQQRPGTAPWLFLAEGKKGAKPFLQVEAPLIIEGEGGFSREVLDIYRKKDNV